LMEANYFGKYPLLHIPAESEQVIMILLLNNKI